MLLWVVMIAEGVVIFGLCSWVAKLDRLAHERLVDLEAAVAALRLDLSNKAEKTWI